MGTPNDAETARALETLRNRMAVLERLSSVQPASRAQITVMVSCLVVVAVSCAFLACYLAFSVPRFSGNLERIYSLLSEAYEEGR